MGNTLDDDSVMEPIDIGSALKIGRATHAGMSGKHNEDYYGLFAWRMQDGRPFYLGVVADGVGGQNAGEVASQLAVRRIGEYFTELAQVNNVLAHLERAILAAHEAVYQYSQDHPETQGMATTMVVAAILDNRLYTATVGDSRVYFWREGRLRQISVDHTWAQEAIEAGLLTPEQARTHPNRNVIKRFLGSSGEVQVDQRLMWEEGQSDRVARGNQGMVLEPGDTILLNSDGLTDMIEDSAVLQSLHQHYYELAEAADELIVKANEGGGKDNITALILQVPGGRLPAGVGLAPAVTGVVPAVPASPAGVRGAAAAAAAVPVEAEAPRRSGLAIALIVGGVGLLALILVLGVGGLLLAAGDNGDDAPSATPTVAVVQPAATASIENRPTTASSTTESPATAILIVETVAGTVQPVVTASASATSPALIPTLQATWTPTRIPPTRTRTPTPTATPVVIATDTPDGGGGQPPPPPPPATEPPPPTATPPPD